MGASARTTAIAGLSRLKQLEFELGKPDHPVCDRYGVARAIKPEPCGYMVALSYMHATLLPGIAPLTRSDGSNLPMGCKETG